MANTPHRNVRDAEESPQPKKPPGYREFEKLLKTVVKAPPLKRPRQIDK
jgi:hypothetical protein